MSLKLKIILLYLAARSREVSTWQGIAILTGASVSHYGFLMDTGACALIGTIIYAIFKIIWPDAKPPVDVP